MQIVEIDLCVKIAGQVLTTVKKDAHNFANANVENKKKGNQRVKIQNIPEVKKESWKWKKWILGIFIGVYK